MSPGLDFDLTWVGAPVRRSLVELLGQAIGAQHLWRRRLPGQVVYQRDQSIITRGTVGSSDAHTWAWHVGPVTRAIRFAVLCFGATGGSPAVPGNLLVRTSAPAATTNLDMVNPAGSNTFFEDVSLHQAIVAVTPDTDQVVTLEMTDATNVVRILAAVVEELPISRWDISQDTYGGVFLGVNPYLYPSGQGIIDPDYDDLCLAVNNLRRTHKKILHHDDKHKQITTVSSTFEDLYTRSTGAPPGAPLEWEYYAGPNLPETADPSLGVKVLVLGSATGGAATGTVRLRDGSGNTVDVALNGTLAVRNATGSIDRDSGVFTLSGQVTAGVTRIDVYAITVEVQNEST